MNRSEETAYDVFNRCVNALMKKNCSCGELENLFDSREELLERPPVIQSTVLIIDDEPNILTSLRRALEVEGYQALVAGSGRQGLEKAAKEGPDLVLLDVAMPEMDGMEVLSQLKNLQPDLPVIIMSGHATIETAVRATKLGAFDFVEKPLSTEKILITVENALKLSRLHRENLELRLKVGGDSEMIGRSPVMRHIFEVIRKTAPSQGRVLITGPNGTGKELVARAIHLNSKRTSGPFIKVNCAAIPQELIESELFGHEKGAFTGATQMRRGKFELAHGGTLFLDEIGDMSPGAQSKVLRALQEGEIERVGGSETIRVDVRVVAATNKDLPQEIEKGRFREDLFYRLNVVPIAVAPLREHKEDIPLLVDHFLKQACQNNDQRLKRVEQDAVSLLMQYDWPGNVRELKNSIERLVILASGDSITAADAQECLPTVKKIATAYQRGISLREMVTTAEREIVLRALEANGGQVSKTAAELQVERSHLYKKMRTLGIDPRGDS
jgi:DNA-binding NtrC family response regulator